MNIILRGCRFPLCIILFIGITAAETILQDFTNKKAFDAFWDISTWGDADQQYAASNVKFDSVNGLVRLKLNASPVGTKPVCGEITSKRTDFLYGSYRASIKFDSTPGAVVGWFVYKDVPDLHEIDVEYLTSDIKHIHFTLHHIETDVDYRKDANAFDPTAAFHEYRFDWYRDKVVYFIDGTKFDSLSVKVPDAACAIMLNYWSANIDDWGGPAPTKDTYMYIDYVHYYSDYGATTIVPVVHGRKKAADFKIAEYHPRLFNCIGQIVDSYGRGTALMMPVPGVFIIDVKTDNTAARLTLERHIVR
jgi:beta-glucanase (GH16 family)